MMGSAFLSTLALFLGAAAEPPGKIREIIVVFKTHFDIGYTDLARNVVERYRTSMIDQALEVCDATQKLPAENRFVWTLPGWPMAQVLGEGQTPDRRRRIEAAVRDGLLVWHALPVTTHTESLDLEDLVRGMGFSSRLSRGFHLPLPRDAKMTDVPSHSWILPAMLRRAGVEFLHIGCNAASGSPEVPRLFYWEGPDGSRILTMYTAESYGTGLVAPADWPAKTWLALIHTGDNHGPPAPGEVQQLLEEARRQLPGVKVRMGRLSDFADAIFAEKPDLPVVRADMPDTWIHGILSMPVETGIARNLRPRIGALESLNALLALWGVPVPPAKAAVASAYEGSLLYGEHTWGASVSQYYSPRVYGKEWEESRAKGKYEFAEESWREHGSYIRKAREIAEPALAGNLEALARAVKAEGPRIAVFNPLPWKRDGMVSVEVPAAAPEGLKDAETGEIVPAERIGSAIRFAAREVPALGYRTYLLAPTPARGEDAALIANGSAIENGSFKVQLDPARGVVASLTDKLAGRELVDRESPHGLGQYLYERFDDAIHQAFLKAYLKSHPAWSHEFGHTGLPPEAKYAVASPKDFKLDLRKGAVSVTATMSASADALVPHDVSLKVTLFRDQPCVDLEWTIRDKKPDPWPEAGWLCLPLKVDRPAFRLGRPGAIIDPAHDTVRASNNEVFCLWSGMTVSSRDGAGVGLCPLDSPLVSIGHPGVFRFSREFGDRKPWVFVNLFNNIWGTNFQQWIGGTWSSRVRLWAGSKRGDEADLLTPSWEARSPFEAALYDGPPGTLPPSRAGLELSRKGVLVTALGANPDGDGTLLRLWEQAGEDGPCRIRLPEGLKASEARPCDLRGRPLEGPPVPVREGSLEVNLTRYAPVSWIFERRP